MKAATTCLALLVGSIGLTWFGYRTCRTPSAPQPAAPLDSSFTRVGVERRAQSDGGALPALPLPAPSVAPPPVARSDRPAIKVEAADAVRAWARGEPATAVIWLSRAPPGLERDAVLEIVCAEVVQFDPAEAVRLAESYSGGDYRLLENLVHQWAALDRTAAAEFAQRKPPGELRDRLLSRIALVLAGADPAAAADQVLTAIPPGEVQDEALISVLHQWSLRDPLDALAWVRRFPAGTLRSRAIAEIEAATRAAGG